MSIQQYKLPQSREARLRTYYELRDNADLVAAQVNKTLKYAKMASNLSYLAPVLVFGGQFLDGIIGSVAKFASNTLNANGALDSKSEQDRIVNTFDYYDKKNATHHKNWHTMDLSKLMQSMEGIQRDIQSIKESKDNAKRRYLPARLHMASGLARIISQKQTGLGGVAGLNEGKDFVSTGLALGALYLSTK